MSKRWKMVAMVAKKRSHAEIAWSYLFQTSNPWNKQNSGNPTKSVKSEDDERNKEAPGPLQQRIWMVTAVNSNLNNNAVLDKEDLIANPYFVLVLRLAEN